MTGPGSRLLTETVIARVMLGVIALHVVDDSFLQPPPGTAARDHLLSGLVPLAVLTLLDMGRIRCGPAPRREETVIDRDRRSAASGS